MTILICMTCPRYEAATRGTFVDRFVAAYERVGAAGGAAPTLRRVSCLGGCPRAGVAAVDGAQKARVRFTGLVDAGDDVVAGLVRFAEAHERSTTGEPAEVEVPDSLAPHLSSVTRKRGSRSPT